MARNRIHIVAPLVAEFKKQQSRSRPTFCTPVAEMGRTKFVRTPNEILFLTGRLHLAETSSYLTFTRLVWGLRFILMYAHESGREKEER